MMINPMSQQRAAVLTVLQQAGRTMRPVDIAAVAQMKPRSVSMMLLRMRDDGQTELGAYGWRATAGGLKALEKVTGEFAGLGGGCATKAHL
jgi:Mn-dependent DtxR family transcriptional regulator